MVLTKQPNIIQPDRSGYSVKRLYAVAGRFTGFISTTPAVWTKSGPALMP
jgi:hypothetical protein